MTGIQLQKRETSSTWLAKDFFDHITKNERRNNKFKHLGIVVGSISLVGAVGIAVFGHYHGLPMPFVHPYHNIYAQVASSNGHASFNKMAQRITSWAQGPLGIVMATATILVSAAMAIARQSAAPIFAGVVFAGSFYFGPTVLSSVMGPLPGGQQQTTTYRKLQTAFNPHLIEASTLAVEAQKKPLTATQQKQLKADIDWISGHSSKLSTGPLPALLPNTPKLEYRLALSLPANQQPPLAIEYLHHYQGDRAQYDKIMDQLADTADAGMAFGVLAFSAYAIRRRSVNTARRILQGV